MIQKRFTVGIELRVDAKIAEEVAQETFFRMNPHQSEMIARDLQEAGVDVDTLVKYYVELSKAVAEFWNSVEDPKFKPTVAPHEMRSLYLPLMYAVIFSSVGIVEVGNYRYVIMARADEKPDREFLLTFSATLEGMRDFIKGDVGQIGYRLAQPQTAVMMCLLGEVAESGRNGRMLIRDGQQVDTYLAGISTLIGLSLKEEAYKILYTGVEEVNFRQLCTSVVEKPSVKTVASVDG